MLSPASGHASLPGTPDSRARPTTRGSFKPGGYQQGRIAYAAQAEAQYYTPANHHDRPLTQSSYSVSHPEMAGSRESFVVGDEGRVIDDEIPVPRPRLQTMLYGLSRDLRSRVERRCPIEARYVPRGNAKLEMESIKTFTPSFSVELAAKSFDERERPVYAGRAALIRGVVRVHAIPNRYIVIRVSRSSPTLKTFCR